MNVTPRASISCCSIGPSDAVSREARTIRAPTVSGSRTSETAISNDSVVIASIVSADVRPGARCTLASRFTTARCGTSTPFGMPVEPDV